MNIGNTVINCRAAFFGAFEGVTTVRFTWSHKPVCKAQKLWFTHI